MLEPLNDNSYGNAQLPGSPEALKEKLQRLRKDRDARNRLHLKRPHARPEPRAEILKKTGGLCHICGGEIPRESYWEADHIFAAAAGGRSESQNFLPAHGLCNTYKWDHCGEEFQWVLKIGVWAKKQIEGNNSDGNKMLEAFWDHECHRIKRQKARGKAAGASL
jgi:5-methylcytosine-specific restriction endonuclease McrA